MGVRQDPSLSAREDHETLATIFPCQSHPIRSKLEICLRTSELEKQSLEVVVVEGQGIGEESFSPASFHGLAWENTRIHGEFVPFETFLHIIIKGDLSQKVFRSKGITEVFHNIYSSHQSMGQTVSLAHTDTHRRSESRTENGHRLREIAFVELPVVEVHLKIEIVDKVYPLFTRSC